MEVHQLSAGADQPSLSAYDQMFQGHSAIVCGPMANSSAIQYSLPNGTALRFASPQKLQTTHCSVASTSAASPVMNGLHTSTSPMKHDPSSPNNHYFQPQPTHNNLNPGLNSNGGSNQSTTQIPFDKSAMDDFIERKCKTPPNFRNPVLVSANSRVAATPMNGVINGDRKRPYPCNMCASKFGSKMELEEHQNSHTGQKPFQCDVCQSRFNRRSTLWNHKRIHSDAKPFMCTVCHMTFKWKNSLKCHKEMHMRKNEANSMNDAEIHLLTYATAAKKQLNDYSEFNLIAPVPGTAAIHQTSRLLTCAGTPRKRAPPKPSNKINIHLNGLSKKKITANSGVPKVPIAIQPPHSQNQMPQQSFSSVIFPPKSSSTKLTNQSASVLATTGDPKNSALINGILKQETENGYSNGTITNDFDVLRYIGSGNGNNNNGNSNFLIDPAQFHLMDCVQQQQIASDLLHSANGGNNFIDQLNCNLLDFSGLDQHHQSSSNAVADSQSNNNALNNMRLPFFDINQLNSLASSSTTSMTSSLTSAIDPLHQYQSALSHSSSSSASSAFSNPAAMASQFINNATGQTSNPGHQNYTAAFGIPTGTAQAPAQGASTEMLLNGYQFDSASVRFLAAAAEMNGLQNGCYDLMGSTTAMNGHHAGDYFGDQISIDQYQQLLQQHQEDQSQQQQLLQSQSLVATTTSDNWPQDLVATTAGDNPGDNNWSQTLVATTAGSNDATAMFTTPYSSLPAGNSVLHFQEPHLELKADALQMQIKAEELPQWNST